MLTSRYDFLKVISVYTESKHYLQFYMYIFTLLRKYSNPVSSSFSALPLGSTQSRPTDAEASKMLPHISWERMSETLQRLSGRGYPLRVAFLISGESSFLVFREFSSLVSPSFVHSPASVASFLCHQILGNISIVQSQNDYPNCSIIRRLVDYKLNYCKYQYRHKVSTDCCITLHNYLILNEYLYWEPSKSRALP